jgi:hypothetical protein
MVSKAISALFGRPASSEEAEREKIRRAWARERARSVSPSQRAEIDAIFSRYL